MPRSKIDSLQPGMVLGGDVTNVDGTLLIPAGVVLTDRQISLLRSWGVQEVETEPEKIIEQQGKPVAGLSPELLQRVTRELRSRFTHLDESSSVQMEVFNLALNRKLCKLRAGKPTG